MADQGSPNTANDSDIENFLAGPVNVTPTKRSVNLRHGGLDKKLFASLSASSPSQAKKALEAHIVDTDRRIREASKLGTSLLEQKKLLAEHLKDVESHTASEDVGPELRQKLADLEREYNDLGRESARAFLPRSRRSGLFSEGTDDLLSGQRPPSPSKLAVLPNTNSPRKQRNASSRTEDLAFATEISTSLLNQLRHLQNVLAENENALRDANTKNAQLSSDAEASSYRLRALDENEQRYKDENWNLETQVQDLTTQLKDASIREQKLTQSLNTVNNDKTAIERESDDTKLAHSKLTEEHAALRKKHDLELASLRRSAAAAETEKQTLNRKIADLAAQNEELAKAVSYRATADPDPEDRDISSEADFVDAESVSADGSPPPSPTKGTPRPGALESETLKSSLHHAHRMIQNLKNNIHREKTEKLELRRLLQDTRDELEARRADSSNNGANLGRRRKPNSQPELFKKPSLLNKLGLAKTSKDEIINDPAWEEYEDSPSRDRGISKRDSAQLSTDQSEGFETANETDSNANETDGFETATERGSNANETDAFESALSAAGEDSEGDLTETEESQSASNSRMSLRDRGAAVRSSYQSTASDDADMFNFQSSSFNTSTEPPRYKLKLGRGGLRKASDTPSARDSPASFTSNQSTPVAHQDLAAELEDIGDETSMVGSTPGRSIPSATPSPELDRKRETIIARTPESVTSRPAMTTSGTMTDSWEPQIISQSPAPASGGEAFPEQHSPENLAVQQRELSTKRSAESVVRTDTASLPSNPVLEADTPPIIPLVMSPIVSQHTEPLAPELPAGLDEASLMRSPNLADPVLPRMSGQTVARVPSSIAADTVVDPSDIEERDMFQSSPAMSSGLFISRLENSYAGPESPALDPASWPTATGARAHIATPASPMKDEGTQTTVSSEQIENLIKDKNNRSISTGSQVATPPRLSPGRAMSMGSKSAEQVVLLDPPNKSPKRPGSAGSLARSAGSPSTKEAPPLPPGHKEVIAAMSKPGSASTSMPPPLVPASPIRNFSQPMRPQSPLGQGSAVAGPSNYATAVDGTSTSIRSKPPSVAGRSDVTRRTSISSFASEVEDRFKPASAYPAGDYGFEAGADPRMIQAITQTMIGEFMYKYTRKAGRGDHSDNRHRRFFWIHPYTRTLYWSTRDPARAGRAELKAKSVPIEAVRVVFDDNSNPPGLHNKSIIIVTPGRTIKLTAPTSHRHDTWFNALSYLLMRNNANDRETDLSVHARPYTTSSYRPRSKARSNSITADDVSEFNPTLVNRSSVRGTAGSTNSVIRTPGGVAARMSGAMPQNQSGFTSPRRNMPPTDTPQGVMAAFGSASQRSLVSQEPQGTPTPARTTVDVDGFKKPIRPASTAVSGPPPSSTPGSVGRKTSFTSRLGMLGRSRSTTHLSQRSPSPMQAQTAYGAQDNATATPTKQPPPMINNISVDRAASARGSTDAEFTQSPPLQRSSSALENVRACCDGKHDVGHLSHTHFSSLSQRHSRAASANSTRSHS